MLVEQFRFIKHREVSGTGHHSNVRPLHVLAYQLALIGRDNDIAQAINAQRWDLNLWQTRP